MADDTFKLTKTELARQLGLSDETITNYVKKGMPVTGRGHAARYNLARCLQWLIDHEADKRVRQGRSGNVTEEDAKVRKLVAEAQMKEYELAQLQGQVVTVTDSENAISHELEKVRGKLVAIPGTWGPRLVGIQDNASAVEALADLVFQLMDDLSNDEPQEEDGIDEPDLSEDETAEDPDDVIDE